MYAPRRVCDVYLVNAGLERQRWCVEDGFCGRKRPPEGGAEPVVRAEAMDVFSSRTGEGRWRAGELGREGNQANHSAA